MNQTNKPGRNSILKNGDRQKIVYKLVVYVIVTGQVNLKRSLNKI